MERPDPTSRVRSEPRLPRRPARSAELYRRIWTDAGSPLLVTTRAQARKLRERRLLQHYRDTPYRATVVQGRSEEGRRDDEVLANALEQLPQLADALHPPRTASSVCAPLAMQAMTLPRRGMARSARQARIIGPKRLWASSQSSMRRFERA